MEIVAMSMDHIRREIGERFSFSYLPKLGLSFACKLSVSRYLSLLFDVVSLPIINNK
jgi:hypothetical protein